MVPGPYLSLPGSFVGDLSVHLSANLKKCTKSVQFYTLFPENGNLGGFKANRAFSVAL
jgi:hypothetical protein